MTLIQPNQPEPDSAAYELAGIVAIVTGADTDLGRTVAILLARAGADVVLAYQGDRQEAEQTRKQLLERGRRVVLVHGDPTDASATIDAAFQQLGRIDVIASTIPSQH
ncbi:SDR family NAD(P)-dependent oxidoreductase [Nocardia heshunensis]